MPKTDKVYKARLQFGVPESLRRRFLAVAREKEMQPGELFRLIISKGVENYERTKRAQRERRGGGA